MKLIIVESDLKTVMLGHIYVRLPKKLGLCSPPKKIAYLFKLNTKTFRHFVPGDLVPKYNNIHVAIAHLRRNSAYIPSPRGRVVRAAWGRSERRTTTCCEPAEMRIGP